MSRVNARLDEQTTERLTYLKAATGLSLSDIVRESVARYYALIKAEAARRGDGLDALVGAFDGDPDTSPGLSTDYKDRLWSAPAAPTDPHPAT